MTPNIPEAWDAEQLRARAGRARRARLAACPEPYRSTMRVALTYGVWPGWAADLARQQPEHGSAAKLRRHLRWLVEHGHLEPAEVVAP